MKYISLDGSIRERPRSLLQKFSGLQLKWKAAIVVGFAFGANRILNPNPFANGKIPAASLNPNEHWNRIYKDDGFVRSMTQHLGSNKRKGEATLAAMEFEIGMETVDFGGPDGHVIENGDLHDVEYMRGTRCSTTRSAITAYFCGADVASNQDVGLGKKRKGFFSGVKSFAEFLSCRHEQGERTGEHHRSVYRIGIGNQDNRSGYSHAFSIIAQPDGSFYWLQSFIKHYSLQNWMEKVDAVGNSYAHLSLKQLQSKLEQVSRLMNISSWSPEANDDYYELFGVDKEKEALKRGKPPVHSTWKPTHRLDSFAWDEACEYPLPTSDSDPESPVDDESNNSNQYSNDSYSVDECLVPLIKSMLFELREELPSLS